MRNSVPVQPKSDVASGRPWPVAGPTASVPRPPAPMPGQRPAAVMVTNAASAGVTNAGRVHLLGIDERPAGEDRVLASLFQTMRASAGMPPGDLVRLLRTKPDVLANLEAGRVRALPPMAETVRLIKDYGALLEIDVEPILSRIKQQTGEKAPPLQAAPATMRSRLRGAVQAAALPFHRRPETLPVADAPPKAVSRRQANNKPTAASQPNMPVASPVPTAMAPIAEGMHPRPHSAIASLPQPQPRQARQPGQTETRAIPAHQAAKPVPVKPPRRHGRRRRLLVTAGISATLLVGAVWTAQSQPSTFYAAVDQMPSGIAKSLRRGLEMIAWRLSSSHDGLTWIETSDPRRRKGDKLPVAGQAR